MQISKVSSITSNTSFKGIFHDLGIKHVDETFYEHGMEKYMGTVQTTDTKEYYPYLNESKSDIENAVKKVRNHKEYMDDCVQYIEETVVTVKDKLPFTETEGKAFMKKFDVPERDVIKFTEFFKLLTNKMPKHK